MRKRGFKYNKSKKRHFKKFFKKTKKFFSKNKYKTSIILTIIIVTTSVFLIVNQTFLAKKNTITNIEFHQSNADIYQDLQLYQNIREKLQNKNIFNIQYRILPSLLEDISQDYPLIKDINLTRPENNMIILKFECQDLGLVFSEGQNNFASIDNQLIKLPNKTSLVSGAINVNIPKHYQNSENFEGFFYNISSQKLKFQIELIQDFFEGETEYFEDQPKEKIQNILYLPGGNKTQITLKDYQIRFDNSYSILDQLKKYSLFVKNKSQSEQLETMDIKQIDVGTQQEYIFVQ